MEHLLNPKNYKEALENKQKIIEMLKKMDNKMKEFKEYNIPTKYELALKIYGKEYNDLIIDDLIVINQILRNPDKFSFFFF